MPQTGTVPECVHTYPVYAVGLRGVRPHTLKSDLLQTRTLSKGAVLNGLDPFGDSYAFINSKSASICF